MEISGILIGYIDPNTTHHVFTFLASFLGVLGLILGVLAWPLRSAVSRARERYRRLPRGWRIVVATLLVAAIVGAGGAVFAILVNRDGAMTARKTEAGVASRVVVLGMDGLDPGIVEKMMAAGELPNFARLAEIGGYARLATSAPPESPVAWSTIATGCGPGEHGIFDFLQRDPKTYLPFLSLRKSTSGLAGTKYKKARRRDGFWAYTSAAGIPTTVIRWPVAFPAERVNGRFLSGLGVPDLLGGEGRYYHFTSTPLDEDDPSPRNVVQVRWDGRLAKTEIRGPATGEDRYAKLGMTVSRSGRDCISIAIQDAEPVKAAVGEWSEWVPLRFSVGLRKVNGLIKFMPTEVDPHLRLTSSPIHMHPGKQAFPFATPKGFGVELLEKLGPFHTLGMCEQPHPVSHGRYGLDEFLAECRAIDAERLKMLDLELERFESGLLAFVFDTSDRLQHVFWSTRDPQHPTHDPELASRYADVIPGMYRDMDAVLGRVLGKISNDTALIVLSDHGFGSFRRSVHLNRWLIENHYMKLTGDNKKEGREILEDVDWSRTRAYAMGFASIYLNLSGREGEGIVDPEGERRRLCEEIASALREWTDPENGKQIVSNVYIGSEVNPGPAAAEGPDLIVGFNEGYRASWQTALGAAPIVLLEDNTKPWSGTHLIDPTLVPGILFCNQKIKRADPRLMDIAPTVLRCFGIERPAHMTGEPLF